MLRAKGDGSYELVELIDNQGKDLHYHDKEPDDHESRVPIDSRFKNTTEVINFFQDLVQARLEEEEDS